MAGALSQRFGVQPGDRVAIAARNRADHFTLQFACWKIGAIFSPLNWRLADAELSEIVALAEPALLICDSERPIETGTATLLHFSDLQDGIDGLVTESPAISESFASANLQRVLTLLFTSGTTGKPKAVPYTEEMVLCTVLHTAAHAMVDSDTHALVIAPLFHSAGLFAATTPTFHFGGLVAVDNHWDPQECLARLADPALQITHFNGVPTIFKQLAELPAFRDAEFSHLKMLGIGSAPIARDLLDQWRAKGVYLSQSYGMTEAFGVSITPPDDPEHFIGSAGVRMLHTQLRVVRDGEDVPVGDVGEIWLRGPTVLPYYWRKDGVIDKACFVDGWFPTGDLARQDERGALYIVDRLKDMIISGGENIYPAEIEHVLETHPAIRAVAVVGLPHEQWGETPVAVLEPRNGEALDAAELRDFCVQRLARFKVPAHWFAMEKLGHSAQGKQDKVEIRRAVLEHHETGSSRAGLRPLDITEFGA